MHLIPVLFGIILVVFLMVRLIPGDPARIMLGIHASPERLADLRAQLGLDQPIWRQFTLFLGNVVRGDLGISLVYRRPVLDVIFERLPPTIFLIAYAAVLSLLLTIPLSLWAAIRQNRLPDQAIRMGATMTLSMPGFWLGLNLLILFAVRVRWFPVAGYGDDFVDRLWHLFLPALTITLSLAPMLIRNLRSGLIDVLKAPYVEFARAKGIRERGVLGRHVLRNGMISTVTILGINIGWLLGGSVVIESVFTLPGLGSLIVSSIYARDYPVIQGVTLVFGFLVISINLITDLVYAMLDPRVTYD
jgi:peptide/nickel transport system permease protein